MPWRIHLYSLILLLSVTLTACSQTPPTFKEGDLIFQQSRSSQSLAIQQATRSPYSHMGIILLHNGQPHVFEATAQVRFTPVEQWIKRGEGEHYVLKRLSNADTLLTPQALTKLQAQARLFTGKSYDLTFEWSDQRIYCSELVWKMYQRALAIEIGNPQKLREFNLSTPAVQNKLRERYGKNIPMDETVISPVAMFESPLLITIAKR